MEEKDKLKKTEQITKLKVSGKGDTVKLAAAIAGSIETAGKTCLSCIGAAAVNNACKAVATAAHMISADRNTQKKTRLCMVPCFVKRKIGGDYLTTIELTVTEIDSDANTAAQD